MSKQSGTVEDKMSQPTMSIDEFIEALAQTPREWAYLCHSRANVVLRLNGQAVGNRTPICPLEVVANRPSFIDAAYSLGLSNEDRNTILYAADGDRNHDPTLRARLIEACGMEPE